MFLWRCRGCLSSFTSWCWLLHISYYRSAINFPRKSEVGQFKRGFTTLYLLANIQVQATDPDHYFTKIRLWDGQKHSGSSPCKICSTTNRDGNIALRQKWMDTFSSISRCVLYNKQLFLKAPKSRQLCVTNRRVPCRNKDTILCIYPGRERDAILVPLLFIFRFVHTYNHTASPSCYLFSWITPGGNQEENWKIVTLSWHRKKTLIQRHCWKNVTLCRDLFSSAWVLRHTGALPLLLRGVKNPISQSRNFG